MKSIDLIIPVKNGGQLLLDVINAWKVQHVPIGWQYRVIVVDDNSTDGIPDRIPKSQGVTVLKNPGPLGRANACNFGANFSNAEYILICDADCVPINNNVLSLYADNIITSADVIFGGIVSRINGFWGFYFNMISKKRAIAFQDGDQLALTTANCVFKHSSFNKVNGFHPSYTQCGFEDKDLIARCIESSFSMIYLEEAAVTHDDDLSLNAICRKMYLAGKNSGLIFKLRHTQIYNKSKFSRFDCSIHPSLKIICTLTYRLHFLFLTLGNLLIKSPLPFTIKSKVVQVLSALSYMIGTANKDIEI